MGTCLPLHPGSRSGPPTGPGYCLPEPGTVAWREMDHGAPGPLLPDFSFCTTLPSAHFKQRLGRRKAQGLFFPRRSWSPGAAAQAAGQARWLLLDETLRWGAGPPSFQDTRQEAGLAEASLSSSAAVLASAQLLWAFPRGGNQE